MPRLMLLDRGTPADVEAAFHDGIVRLPSAVVEEVLGWKLQAEGLCRDEVCVPMPADPAFATESGIALEGLADALRRPLALDIDERAAFLGRSAVTRSQTLASLEAPDFELPDQHGRLHTLSDYRGSKVLLVAYASW